MDDNQNQSGLDQNLTGTPGGIPIKFNMPVTPQPAAETPQTPAASLLGPTAGMDLQPPPPDLEPRSVIRKYLLPICIAASVILAIVLYFTIVSFFKEEGKVITQQVIHTQIEMVQTEQIFTCNANQVLDAENKCICKTNYTITANSDGLCVYDCDNVIGRIKDLQSSPTLAGSTELASQLVELQNSAKDNNCSIPETFKTPCEQMQDDALNEMASKNYIGYYDLSKKYIETDCAKKSLNKCDLTLADAELVNRILALRPPNDAKDELQKELVMLRMSYYTNLQCNNMEERCNSIRIKYGMETATPPTQQSANKLDPSNIFFDDRSYFLQNCVQKPAAPEPPAAPELQQPAPTQPAAQTQELTPAQKAALEELARRASRTN